MALLLFEVAGWARKLGQQGGRRDGVLGLDP